MSLAGTFPLLVAFVTPFLKEYWQCEDVGEEQGCGLSFPTRPQLSQHRQLEHPNASADFESCGEATRKLYKAVTQPIVNPTTGQTLRLWEPMLFMLLWTSTPTASSAMFYFFTNELKFQPEFMGRVAMVGGCFSLIGMLIFQNYLATCPFRTILFWGSLITSCLSSVMLILVTHTNRILHIPDSFFLLGDEAIVEAVGTISFFPVLVLAARICPRGVEGTLYALLMSVLNFGSVISNELGSILTHVLHITATDFTNLWKLILICSCCSLLPLPLLWILRVPNTDVDTIQGQQRLQHNVDNTSENFDSENPSTTTTPTTSQDLIQDSTTTPTESKPTPPLTEAVLHNTVSFNTPIIPSRCLLPCKDSATSPTTTKLTHRRRHRSEGNCCQGNTGEYDKVNDEEEEEVGSRDFPLEDRSSSSSSSSELKKEKKNNKIRVHTHGDLSDEETLRRYPPSPTFPTSAITTTSSSTSMDDQDSDTEIVSNSPPNSTTTTTTTSDELHLHLELPETRARRESFD